MFVSPSDILAGNIVHSTAFELVIGVFLFLKRRIYSLAADSGEKMAIFWRSRCHEFHDAYLF